MADSYLCIFPDCRERILVWPGAGRPRDYCDNHRTESDRKVDAFRMARMVPDLRRRAEEAEDLRAEIKTLRDELDDARRRAWLAERRLKAAETRLAEAAPPAIAV